MGSGKFGREQLERSAQSVRLRRAYRLAHPLMTARLWHGRPGKTSQRRAVGQLVGQAALLVLGGNRTGKTEAGAQLCVAMALGGDHPEVREWIKANQLPARLVPPGPGKCCASALTSGDSVRYLREKIDRYLPPGASWHNRFGQGEAWVQLSNGGTILCKSNDQGRRSYQGDSWRFLWLDEEHDEPIWDEALMRLLDQSGQALMSMTPLKGFTWVKQRFLDKPDPGNQVAYLYMEDNPWLPKKEVQRAIARMPEHQRAARTRGNFVALEGIIYTEWDPNLHVIDPFDIPAHWPRYRAIDFGTRAPFCCLWLARDPSDDTLYVWREHYESEKTTTEHAEIIERLEKEEPPPQWTAADPESLDAIRTLQRRGWAGIRHPGWMKSVEAGISDLKGRLKPDAEGRPHLKVFRGCVNLIREFHAYLWAKGSKEQPHPDCSDHALDALRYGNRLLCRDLAQL